MATKEQLTSENQTEDKKAIKKVITFICNVFINLLQQLTFYKDIIFQHLY